MTKIGLVQYVLLDGLGPVAALAQLEIRWGQHCSVGEGRWQRDWSGYRGQVGRRRVQLKRDVTPRVTSPSVMVAGWPHHHQRRTEWSPSKMVGG